MGLSCICGSMAVVSNTGYPGFGETKFRSLFPVTNPRRTAISLLRHHALRIWADLRGDDCSRLGAIYEHYLGKSYGGPYDDYRRGPLSAQVAVTQCQSGNVVEAIAVLEDQLKRNGFSLPPRG